MNIFKRITLRLPVGWHPEITHKIHRLKNIIKKHLSRAVFEPVIAAAALIHQSVIIIDWDKQKSRVYEKNIKKQKRLMRFVYLFEYLISSAMKNFF